MYHVITHGPAAFKHLRDPYATIEHHVTVKPQDRRRESKS